MIFTSSKIFLDSETAAEQLRSARQAKGWKLADAALKLNINGKYLEAMEKGEWEKLPDGVYGKNFLKEYALLLGLDYNELYKLFEKESAAKEKVRRKELFSRQLVKGRDFLAAPKIARSAIIAAAVIICLFYLGYRLQKIVSPPFLLITSPAENIMTAEKSIAVKGMAESESQVSINGEQALCDGEGNFSKTVDLKSGVNIITIVGRKKYGRENIITRQILVK